MNYSDAQFKRKQIKKYVFFIFAVFILTLLFVKDAFASDTYVKILNNKTVQYSASLPEIPISDDDVIYLYELKTYENAIPDSANPIASVPISSRVSIRFSLNHKQEDTRLYSKFVLATKVNDTPVMINTPKYITNPEKLATHTKEHKDINKALQHESITNLVIKGTGNIPLASNPVVVLLARKGSVITHPLCSVKDSHPIDYQYCMFNAANEEGVNGLIKDLTYEAAYSKGQDFIVGNEVHERVWNYMAYVDWKAYVKEYAKAFRVCYNAIKSENANAKVYISLGQDWNRDRDYTHPEFFKYIDAKDFVDIFNEEISAGGNIDWAIAIHPYTVPLTYAKFWDMDRLKDGDYFAEQIISNKMISFQNLSVETDYLAKFKNPQGEPRTMFISEIGLSNTSGDKVQAAAIAASWMAYKRNPYISGYMYLSNIGDGVDSRLVGQGLKMYKALGTKNEDAMLNWAKSYIGITDWDEILR